jgi:hypothetical protein
MKAVDVLARIDSLDHALDVDLRRQWQLHENAAHGSIRVQSIDECEQLRFAYVARQIIGERLHSHAVGRFTFVANIDLRRGVLADEDHRKTRRGPSRGDALAHFRADLRRQSFRDGFAVDDPRTHIKSGR